MRRINDYSVMAEGAEAQFEIEHGDTLFLDGTDYEVIEIRDDSIKCKQIDAPIYPAPTRILSANEIDALHF